MRKWLRRLALAAGVLVGLAVVISIVLPWWVARSRRHLIVDALQSAQSVRVEEFDDGGKTLLKRDLDGAQRQALIGIIPAIVPRGFPLSFKLCFVPHHRIIARSADGGEFEITICFECDQARHTGSAIYDMPPAGSALVREFIETSLADMKKRREYCLKLAMHHRVRINYLMNGYPVVLSATDAIERKRGPDPSLEGRAGIAPTAVGERELTEAERTAWDDKQAQRSAHYAWHLEWARRFERAASRPWEEAPSDPPEPDHDWNRGDCRFML